MSLVEAESDLMVGRVETGKVVIEQEIGERNRHGDFHPLDIVKTTDRQEEDLAWFENAFEDLRFIGPWLGLSRSHSTIDPRKNMEIVPHERHIP